MKAADIEPGREYLANVNGTGRYGTKGKARVIEATTNTGGEPVARRAVRSGAKLWRVEWLAPYRSDRFSHLPLGEVTVIPSSYIERLWTDQDEGKIAQERAWESEAEELVKRLRLLFGLETPGHFTDDDRPEIKLTGQKTAVPSFTLNKRAVEQILEKMKVKP